LIGGNDDTLDSVDEKQKLLSEFRIKKETLLDQAMLSQDRINDLIEAISGSSIQATNQDYTLEFSVNDRAPLISLESQAGEKAWLVYDNDVETHGRIIIPQGNKIDYVPLRHYPVKLIF
jgi:hypothetical protein